MYSRTIPCPDCERTRRLLQEHAVPFEEVMIDRDPTARVIVESLTGFLAVPTLVVSGGGRLPASEPRPLERGRSPRGVDRGPIITEPDTIGLKHWLQKHGFIGP